MSNPGFCWTMADTRAKASCGWPARLHELLRCLCRKVLPWSLQWGKEEGCRASCIPDPSSQLPQVDKGRPCP